MSFMKRKNFLMLILISIRKLHVELSELLLSVCAVHYCHDPHREAWQFLKSIRKKKKRRISI